MEWSSFGIGAAVAAPVVALAVAWLARIRLARARRMAQRAKGQHELAALGSLAAGLAHEIKNPLSTIKLNLQLLCEDFTDRTDDDSADIIDVDSRLGFFGACADSFAA